LGVDPSYLRRDFRNGFTELAGRQLLVATQLRFELGLIGPSALTPRSRCLVDTALKGVEASALDR